MKIRVAKAYDFKGIKTELRNLSLSVQTGVEILQETVNKMVHEEDYSDERFEQIFELLNDTQIRMEDIQSFKTAAESLEDG